MKENLYSAMEGAFFDQYIRGMSSPDKQPRPLPSKGVISVLESRPILHCRGYTLFPREDSVFPPFGRNLFRSFGGIPWGSRRGNVDKPVLSTPLLVCQDIITRFLQASWPPLVSSQVSKLSQGNFFRALVKSWAKMGETILKRITFWRTEA